MFHHSLSSTDVRLDVIIKLQVTHAHNVNVATWRRRTDRQAEKKKLKRHQIEWHVWLGLLRLVSVFVYVFRTFIFFSIFFLYIFLFAASEHFLLSSPSDKTRTPRSLFSQFVLFFTSIFFVEPKQTQLFAKDLSFFY